MGTRATIVVLALVLLQGCGGSGGDAEKADTGPPPGPDGGASARRLTDAAIGYSLLMPFGWTFPGEHTPGQPVPLGGAGQGCVIGQGGVLGDVRGRKLLAFARQTAARRAAKGTKITVESIRGQNVSGALVRIVGRGQEARSAIFASAGSGVAITCRATSMAAARQGRDLALLLSSVNLRREPRLERAQIAAVRVPGVQAAAVRRDGSRVAAQLRVRGFEDVGARLRDVIVAMAPVLPQSDIAVNAATAAQPQRVALGRYLGGTKAGSVQVPGQQPRRFALR